MSRDPRLLRWLDSVLATPGLTGLTDPDEAWRTLVEAALPALPYVTDGPVADVGAGGGSPGIPLAACRPDLHFDLVESSRRKCAFLGAAARDLANVSVVCARAEEHGRDQGRDAYAVVLARALAPQPVAAEWCLPLVRPGGRLVLYASELASGLGPVVAQVGGGEPEFVSEPDAATGLVVIRKLEPTPERFPRRPGIARKRPLR